MKTLSIREMREALPNLDTLVAEEGEIVVTRRGEPIARVVPAKPKRRMPSHADFRARMPYQEIPSEVLIREDRDSRE